MKVAVINFSGNVGKSTIASHLLAPRMNDAHIIPVESINSDGTQDETIRGKQFGELQNDLSLLDDVVVDVGASNVEDFVSMMKQYEGSHEDYDYFVIPTVPKAKQQRDTISTIEVLSEIGVQPEKILVVFNMVDIEDVPSHIFSGIFEYAEINNNCTINTNAIVHINEIYGKINGSGKTITEIMNDPTDYKELSKNASDPADKLRYAQLLGVKRLATGVSKELDAVFNALFK